MNQLKAVLLFLFSFSEISGFGVGTTLPLSAPFGVRSQGMGEVGYALADDESVLFYNPAGLALKNDRWNGGAVCASNASLSLGIAPNRSYAAVYQNSGLNKLGFSVYLDHWAWPDQEGYIGPNGTIEAADIPSDYEVAGAAGGGYTFFSNGSMTHSFGIVAKYYSEVSFSVGSGIIDYWDPAGDENFNNRKTQNRRYTVSFDAGYLAEFINRFHVGIVFKNMGPAVRNVKEDSHPNPVDQPLLFATGFGYKDVFGPPKVAVLDLATELSHSLLMHYRDRENTLRMGIELLLFRTWAFRFGYNYTNYLSKGDQYSRDHIYLLRLVSLGTGIRLFNHFEADVFMTIPIDEVSSPGGASLTFTRALNWKRSDLRWWHRQSDDHN